jgi:TonB family protein
MMSVGPATAGASAGAVADRLIVGAASPRLRLAAFGFAVAVHAGLLYVLAHPAADTLAGGDGRHFDAVGVTIVSSAALESRHADLAEPPAAGPVEDDAGSTPVASPQSEQRESQGQQEQPEPVEAPAMVPALRETPDHNGKDASTPASAGGVTSRGDTAKPANGRAAAAASPGAVREYERYVAQALAKAKPKGIGTFGTVKVKLVIAPGGGLASVEIAGSSGSKRLDAMAIAAVQHAVLPAPPPGLAPAQLTYVVPYHFR